MRPAPRPRTRTDALAARAVCGVLFGDAEAPLLVAVPSVGVVVPPEPPALVPERVGTGTVGTGTEGSVVVTQPTTGRQSSGAAGEALVNVPAVRRPAARTPAARRARPAVASLLRGVGGAAEGVMFSL